MPVSVRVLSVIGLTLALAPLAPEANLRADERDEAGVYTQSAPTSPSGSPLPRMRPAIGIDSPPRAEPLPVPPPAQKPRPTPAPAPSPAPARPAPTPAPVPTTPVLPEPPPPPKSIGWPPAPGAEHDTPPSGYTRTIRDAIKYSNDYGRPLGRIKMYAREGEWGPAVEIQDCFGDNIQTKFSVVDSGETGRLWFQYKDASHGNGRQRRWVMVDPGMIIRGRTIHLRAQSSSGSDIIGLKVIGNCIDQ